MIFTYNESDQVYYGCERVWDIWSIFGSELQIESVVLV